MGSMIKKKKKSGGNIPVKSLAKSTTPTTIELAFRQAEEKKKAEAQEVQKSPASEVAFKASKTAPTAPMPVSPPEKKQGIVVSSAQKTYIPTPKEPKNSETDKPIPPVKNAAAQPRQMIQPQKETIPLNIGIKQSVGDALSLNIEANIALKSKPISRNNAKSKNQMGNDQVNNGKARKEIDVVIGFDFGTSSSKLVIRDSGRQTAYAIPFGRFACKGNDYLMPTKIFINKDGAVDLSKGDYEYSDLKIHLMDYPEKTVFEATTILKSISASEMAAAYMALVIRYARLWFLDKTESIYKDTHIYWHINLGIPSKDYDDISTRDSFRTVALSAWRASRLDRTISTLQIKEYLPTAKQLIAGQKLPLETEDVNSPWLHPDFVNTHPEVIMEVVGYARGQKACICWLMSEPRPWTRQLLLFTARTVRMFSPCLKQRLKDMGRCPFMIHE